MTILQPGETRGSQPMEQESDSSGGRTEVPQMPASAGAAGGKREATSQRTPYQAPLLTVALAALVLVVALGELAFLPGPNPGPAPEVATGPIRYRVVFASDARAADIGDLLANEGLSVLSGPDPEGAYVLGAVDPAHARSSVEVLRRLQARNDLVRSSGLAPH